MFVDESGDPGFPADGNWSKFGGSKFFVRVGVIIHGWRWKGWHERMHNFKKQRGLMWSQEIKANHLKQGKGDFAGWDENRRLLFRQDLAKLIGFSNEITLIGVGIDKQKVALASRDRIARPEVRSLELLLERYDDFLENERDKAGVVILDACEETKDDNLRYFQSYLLQKDEHFRNSHIVEGTFFAKSHTSNLLQVADFCSNVFYHQLSKKGVANPEFNAMQARFWRKRNRIQGNGIKVWPV